MTGEKHYRVLVVDDNESGRIIIQKNIERAMPYIEVLEAVSGAEALSVIEKYSIDLVLLDIQMPGMNGYETAEKITKLSSGKHIPIIFITAFDPGEQHREKALQSGGVDYLTKPVSSIELVRLITLYIRFIEREREMNNELVELNEQLSYEIRERKEIEQQLRTSNAKYKAVYTKANDAILLVDDESIVECNDTTFEIFGYLRDDIIGQSVHLLSPPIQRGNNNSKQLMKEYITEARQGNGKRFHWRNQRKDGSSFDSEISLLSYFINGKRYVQATIRKLSIDDPAMSFYRAKSMEKTITEAGNLASAGDMLQEDEASALIARLLQTPACCTDMAGVFQYVNPAFERNTGIMKSRLIGKTFFSFVSGDDLPALESAFEKASKGKEVVTILLNILNERRVYETYRAQLQVVLGARAKTMIIILYESNEQLQEQRSINKQMRFFEGVLNTISEPVLVKGTDFSIRYVNDAFCSLMGKERDELINKPDSMILPGLENEKLRLEEEQLIDQEGILQTEISLKRKDDTELSLLAIEKIIRDVDGAKYPVMVFRDISLRKTAELKLIQQVDINKVLTTLAKALLIPGELSLRQIAEKALSEARSFTGSAEGYIYSIGSAYENEDFLAESSLISKTLRKKYLMGKEEFAEDPLYKSLLQLNSLGLQRETPFILNDPLEYTAQGLPAPLAPEIHNCLFIPAILGDVTVGVIILFNSKRHYSDEDLTFAGYIADIFALAYQNKRAEIMLRSNEARHRALLEAIPSRVYRVHKEGIVLDAKDDKYFSSGVDIDEGGIPIERFFPKEIAAAVMDAADGIFQTKNVKKIEYERFAPGSNLLRFEEAVIVPASEVDFVLVINDVTERILAAKELDRARSDAEAASRLKSNFLAQISHELRTPLNGILGYTQLLKKEKEFSDHIRQSLNIIESSGSHLLSLINEILDLSYFESDEAEPEKSVFSLLALLRGVVVITQEKTLKKGLDFHYRISSKIPPFVKGDEKRLTKALLILLGNAIRYTAEGEVKLYISREDSFTKFIVTDTGSGIPQDEVKNIFLPFHHVNQESISTQDGPGLGLSVFKKLIELMDGRYAVESEVGKGSSFWFEIPLVEAKAPEQAVALDLQSISGYEGERKTVLIIEDAPYNRDLLISMLAGVGLKVEEAVDGLDGIEKAKELMPDLILLDINMPVLNGFKTIELMRTSKKIGKLPVIAMSSDKSTEMRGRCTDAGFNEIIAKPFDMSEIYSKLADELSLTWQYEGIPKASVHIGKKDAIANDPSKVLLPPKELILILQKSAELGDIAEIRKCVRTIEQDHSDYKDFISYVKKLLENYQIEEMVELLKSYSGE